MNVIHRRGWDIPQPSRHARASGLQPPRLSPAGASAIALTPGAALAQRVTDLAKLPDPTADLYPAKRNETYKLDRPITDEKINGHYNNFYEFGTDKDIAAPAQELPIRPWTVKIDGMVEKPMEIGIDDLIRKMTIEERTYRHRCVEAWSMAIAWSGFPFAKFVDFARPLGSAKYVQDDDLPRRQDGARAERTPGIPWPYVEGLTMAEATNELAFLVDRRLRPSARQAARRAAAAGGAVEIRLQVDQIDRAVQLRREAAEGPVGSVAVVGIRLLGQRQSGGAASALEPGERRGDRHRRAAADADVTTAMASTSPTFTRICRRNGCGRGSAARPREAGTQTYWIARKNWIPLARE